MARCPAPRYRTSTSTTAWSKASITRRGARSASSTTPRLAPAPTTRATCSTGSKRRWRRMPKRTDIRSILIIGSGPIVIGQACEFDYSGTQACRVLREEGYRVVLVNSNPATIMTDPEFADATYIEPLDVVTLTRIIEKERPDALLPTLGGQTGLNLAVALHEAGVLETYGVEMIGAKVEAIRTAEDRQAFKVAMTEIGLKVPPSGIAYTVDEARRVAGEV